jgi:ABC-2 type transport system ATP-binding protein
MGEIILVENLQKYFRVAKHYRGFLGAFRNLFSHAYRTVRAVDNITFRIQQGELTGYLGPNGAGKSTTIKMLAGLLVPTAGHVIVNGSIPWKDRKTYVAHIGAVFGQRTTLWWDLPVIESLDLLRFVYRIPKDRFQNNLSEFKQLLDLDPFLDTPVRSLSLGQRMRADLCAALLHDPALLFLDEPTIGLDVVAKENIRQFIQHINRQRGTTVILTTHDMSDVEKLCERVLIIDHGKLLFDGSLEQIRKRFGGKRHLMVDFAEDYPEISVEGAKVTERNGQRVVFEFDRGTLTASVLIGRLTEKYRIQDLEVREPEIEATIRRIYEDKLLEP